MKIIPDPPLVKGVKNLVFSCHLNYEPHRYRAVIANNKQLQTLNDRIAIAP